MTLSAPPEQTLRASRAVDSPSRRIYLIAKGFRPSAILYDDGRRTGVDDPLVAGLAPKVAAPMVVAP